MNEKENKKRGTDNEFLRKVNERTLHDKNHRKKRDLLEGFKFVDSHEVALNPYTKMVCTLYESETKPGMYRIEQRIGYNRVIYDGNFSFVVAETLKELGKSFVPAELKPLEGSKK